MPLSQFYIQDRAGKRLCNVYFINKEACFFLIFLHIGKTATAPRKGGLLDDFHENNGALLCEGDL